MAVELDEFHRALFQDVMASAHADGSYAEQAFFDNFCSRLVDDGELETADYCYFGGHGMRIDGYGGDPASSAGELALVISEFRRGLDLGNFILVLSMLYIVRVLAKARKRPEIAK